MESIAVTGGTTAIKGRLVADHGWDGNVPYALLSHRIGEDGEIQSSNWLLLGTLKPVVFPINNIWTGAHKGTRINIDFKDLAVFEFPPRSNISHWLDSTALRISYTEKRTGGVMAPLDEASINNKGIRCLLREGSHYPNSDQDSTSVAHSCTLLLRHPQGETGNS